MWAFNDATVAATPFARECTGGALVVRCLHDLPAALTQLEQLRSQTGGGCWLLRLWLWNVVK